MPFRREDEYDTGARASIPNLASGNTTTVPVTPNMGANVPIKPMDSAASNDSELQSIRNQPTPMLNQELVQNAPPGFNASAGIAPGDQSSYIQPNISPGQTELLSSISPYTEKPPPPQKAPSAAKKALTSEKTRPDSDPFIQFKDDGDGAVQMASEKAQGIANNDPFSQWANGHSEPISKQQKHNNSVSEEAQRQNNLGPAVGTAIDSVEGFNRGFGRVAENIIQGANKLLFGGSDTINQAVNTIRDQNNLSLAAAQQRSPTATTLGEVAGAVGSGVGYGLGATSLLKSVMGRIAATSLGTGTLAGLQSQKDTMGGKLADAGVGAVLGGAVQGGFEGVRAGGQYLASKMFSQPLSEAAEQVSRGQATTVGQVTGNATIKGIESRLAGMPLAGKPFQKVVSGLEDQVQAVGNSTSQYGGLSGQINDVLESAIKKKAQFVGNDIDGAIEGAMYRKEGLKDVFSKLNPNEADYMADKILSTTANKFISPELESVNIKGFSDQLKNMGHVLDSFPPEKANMARGLSKVIDESVHLFNPEAAASGTAHAGMLGGAGAYMTGGLEGAAIALGGGRFISHILTNPATIKQLIDIGSGKLSEKVTEATIRNLISNGLRGGMMSQMGSKRPEF